MQKNDLGMKFKTIFREPFLLSSDTYLETIHSYSSHSFFLALTAAKIIYMFDLN